MYSGKLKFVGTVFLFSITDFPGDFYAEFTKVFQSFQGNFSLSDYTGRETQRGSAKKYELVAEKTTAETEASAPAPKRKMTRKRTVALAAAAALLCGVRRL
ncbi:hypothetical protein [Candidatus Pseudoscillospira sp. SGI.172]|uniref:hypothetical protein n=1 Tax=Candidatus Pseudoscillospira sp. SGI.172 TaxID=3420582 RepID=UPI00117B068D